MKDGIRQGLMVHEIIPRHYTLLVKVLLVKLKDFSINYDKIVTKNIRDIKIVGFIKIFEQYPHEFKVLSLFQLSSKTVRGFESEI